MAKILMDVRAVSDNDSESEIEKQTFEVALGKKYLLKHDRHVVSIVIREQDDE